jgi:putative flippase GtrA
VHQSLYRKLSRFVTVGLANALIYALATSLYAALFAISAPIASGLGYATAVPMSFFGHRHHTFKSQSALPPQFFRFISSQLFGGVLAVFITWLITDLLGQSILLGVAATILVVAIVSYLVMDNWVFARP